MSPRWGTLGHMVQTGQATPNTLPLWRALRDGAWLTPERQRGYPRLFTLMFAIGLSLWLATGPGGLRDATGRPYFPDFIQFKAAADLTATGAPIRAVWDFWGHHVAVEPFGPILDYWGLPYPPIALLYFRWLAPLPYIAGAWAWSLGTLALAWAVVRRIHPYDPYVLLAFPAVFINFAHGQTGALCAAIFGAALLWLREAPILAGFVLGLLAFKPHFAILVPIAWAAGGHYRASFAAAASVAGLVAASVAAYGTASWEAFTGSLHTSQQVAANGLGGFEKAVTVLSGIRLMGGSLGSAQFVQAVASVTAAAWVVWLWRRPAPHDLKTAGLLAATPLATPYFFDYDLIIVGISMAFFVRESVRTRVLPWETTLLALTWASPLLYRPFAALTSIPLGPLGPLTLVALITTRVVADPVGRPSQDREPPLSPTRTP